MTRLIYGSLIFMLAVACNSPRKSLFVSKSPHEKYITRIADAGLANTVMVRQWQEAAEKSLLSPLTVKIPYLENGYFDTAEPAATGYKFQAKKGEVINLEITKKPLTGFTIFMELWYLPVGQNRVLLQSVDTNYIKQEIEDDGNYHIRIQPELLSGGEYSLSIKSAPSLAFPVPSASKPRIGSFWGDSRDAGARNHEGIDIFGLLRTPVVAAAAGRVQSAGTNRLGGKVIFLRPSGRSFTLYYAHLDSQLVSQGQNVQEGEIIGLMGKTGNAINTPVHLHFGIYSTKGAIDPLPFVNPDRKEPLPVSVSNNLLNRLARTKRKTELKTGPVTDAPVLLSVPANTFMKVTQLSSSWVRVKLPDGREGFATGTNVEALSAIVTRSFSVSSQLLDRPDSLAASKAVLTKGMKAELMAEYNGYYYVKTELGEGWIDSF